MDFFVFVLPYDGDVFLLKLRGFDNPLLFLVLFSTALLSTRAVVECVKVWFKLMFEP